MKYQIMVKMLMQLITRRKVTAGEFAKKYEISVRSVYRYVDELNSAGVPVDVERGRYGGIYIADTFRMPSGYFTRGEYDVLIDALNAMPKGINEDDVVSALEKLQHRQKIEKRELSVCGNIIVDGGAWADLGKLPVKIELCEKAVKESACLEIDYISRSGEHSRRVIDPYVLIYKQNVWYVYAYCHTRQSFRTFKIGRIKSARLNGRNFERKEINRGDIPLNFEYTSEQLIPVTLQIKKDALADVEEWLGVDNIEPRGEGLVATVSLPDDDMLTGKILSYGGRVKVLSPQSLKERVKNTALAIAEERL